eukprot:comp7594_c0_seq1/m.3244 comp7594_c0_seq1/g.3244  ORF comp7594_c0_seq1/g.3244 comp7594_c0_seq1/m.3244 type:complete len:311 (-) comp7594_c0_seq1:265-1197(-)
MPPAKKLKLETQEKGKGKASKKQVHPQREQNSDGHAGSSDDDYVDVTWQPVYWDYKRRFVDDCIIPLEGERKVVLAQAPTPPGKDYDNVDPSVTGSTIWDGGLALAQYLTGTKAIEKATGKKKVKRCLELGAGTGAVGLSVAVCGKTEELVLTDLKCMVPHLEKNVALNEKGVSEQCDKVSVLTLRWGNEEDAQRVLEGGVVDVLVGSDLVYYSGNEQSHVLLDTMKRVCGTETVVFMAFSLQHQPQQVEYFLSLLRESFACVVDVTGEVPVRWRFDDIRVVRADGLKGLAEPPSVFSFSNPQADPQRFA